MGKRWHKALSMALFVVLIALLCAYVYSEREAMARLLRLDAPTVTAMLLLALCACVLNCVYHRVILSTYQIPLSLTDWMGVVLVANAMAYVLPLRADLVFSAAYYKRVKGLKYVKSVSMAAGNIIFGVSFALLQMLAALLCTGLIEGTWPGMLWLVWAAAAAAVCLFIAFSLLMGDRRPKLFTRFKIVSDVADGFNALLQNRRMLIRLLVCLILNNAVQLALYIACFHAIGMNVTVYQALFYNSVSWISTVVAIVPGNIGIKEAVMGAATSLMGAVFQNGVAVSLLQRVAVMIVYVVLGAVWAFPVWRKWNVGRGQGSSLG